MVVDIKRIRTHVRYVLIEIRNTHVTVIHMDVAGQRWRISAKVVLP